MRKGDKGRRASGGSDSEARLCDVLSDPSVWGRSSIVAMQLSDEAALNLTQSGDQASVRAVAATLIGAIKTALFFGDMLGLDRTNMISIVSKTIRQHYPPFGSVREAPRDAAEEATEEPLCPVIPIRPGL